MTVRQRLTLLQKNCLAERVIVLYIAVFALCFTTLAFAALWFKERTSRVRMQCVYESTVELNAFRREQNKENKLFRLGLDSAKIVKQP